MMVAESSATTQAKMLKALLEMAEAQRDMLTDHVNLLRHIRENDERILSTLRKEGTIDDQDGTDS